VNDRLFIAAQFLAADFAQWGRVAEARVKLALDAADAFLGHAAKLDGEARAALAKASAALGPAEQAAK
jgi:hypothetical protein